MDTVNRPVVVRALSVAAQRGRDLTELGTLLCNSIPFTIRQARVARAAQQKHPAQAGRAESWSGKPVSRYPVFAPATTTCSAKVSRISRKYLSPTPYLVSVIARYRNAIAQGADSILGAEVQQLIANLNGLEYRYFSRP